jgi:hypothetical protein
MICNRPTHDNRQTFVRLVLKKKWVTFISATRKVGVALDYEIATLRNRRCKTQISDLLKKVLQVTDKRRT